jgi:hypothetical protein
MREELPGGNFAELRDPATVSERHRRPVARAMARLSEDAWVMLQRKDAAVQRAKEAGDAEDWVRHLTTSEGEPIKALKFSEADVDTLNEANDLAIVALVASWSFPTDITLDNVLDLPNPAYDRLREVVGELTLQMFPNFRPDPSEGSPTEPSSVSEQRSRGLEDMSRPNFQRSYGSTGFSDSV